MLYSLMIGLYSQDVVSKQVVQSLVGKHRIESIRQLSGGYSRWWWANWRLCQYFSRIRRRQAVFL